MTETPALLADIGGTNARFALADLRSRTPLQRSSVRRFGVAEFPSLVAAARHYLEEMAVPGDRVQSAVFAIAGRIDGDEARVTNHPWVISRLETARALGVNSLRLVNDFAAQAMAVELLEPDDLVSIGGVAAAPSSPNHRTHAVLGPGTGLGVSALIVRDGQRIALETEGGHVGFAAGTQEEADILARLSTRYGRVSDERLVSGGGLVNIHRALAEIAGQTVPDMRPQDITAGEALGDPLCRRAIDVFCGVFGAIAGDLALTLGAWDGVFLTGGLVPKLLEDLQRSTFRQRFEAKGRFAEAMARVPTMAIVHPYPGLLGAAAFAMQHPGTPTRQAKAG